MRFQIEFLPASVPHDEEIVTGSNCPAQSRIRADILRFGVVLSKGRQYQIWTPRIATFKLPQALNEVALAQMCEIVFGAEIDLQMRGGRGP